MVQLNFKKITIVLKVIEGEPRGRSGLTFRWCDGWL